MDKQKLKEIFIEEASEIIEKLDVEIINLEDNPGDKDLLNELFRGVHTLKGSANSFGFTRLGEFVHGFEDVLDFYRNSEKEPEKEQIDVFLDAVDVIKEVFEFEINENDGVPDRYEGCIASFKNIISMKDGSSSDAVKAHANGQQDVKDLSSEFGEMESAESEVVAVASNLTELEKTLFNKLDETSELYKITLTMDDDLYLRGQDHTTFMRLLCSDGEILHSLWDFSKTPPLVEMDAQKNYIASVILYFKSKMTLEEVAEIFEYLEEYEYKVEALQMPSIQQTKQIIEEKLEEREEAKPQEESTQVKSQKPIETPKAAPKPEKEKESVKKEVVATHQQKSFVKIDTLKLDELFDSVGELVIAQNFLGENEKIKDIKDESVLKTIETLSKITRLIQNRVMSLRMVPIRDTFEKMKRVVRDASRKVNKEVRLNISGEDTEIDKTMVDALSDPLIHIIRNAIDHGLEATADDRVSAGKASEGEVGLRAYHKGGNIVIEISDDGRGINKEKVYNKALEKGLINEDDELSDSQIFGLIMQAGFSTADKISDISGRGVGLDVVRSSIEDLRGKVEIESKVGEGSKFCILLPLTLAIIDGMLVKSAGETFIIPTLSIIESFRPHEEIVHTAQGQGEFVNLRDELLPIVRLNRILELDHEHPNVWDSTLVCAENENGRFAILVDELVGRQQVVIKTLGKTLAHLKEVSGGAVLGNGEIALILNVEGIYN